MTNWTRPLAVRGGSHTAPAAHTAGARANHIDRLTPGAQASRGDNLTTAAPIPTHVPTRILTHVLTPTGARNPCIVCGAGKTAVRRSIEGLSVWMTCPPLII